MKLYRKDHSLGNITGSYGSFIPMMTGFTHTFVCLKPSLQKTQKYWTLSLVENSIQKKTTRWRKPISPAERLAVCLRERWLTGSIFHRAILREKSLRILFWAISRYTAVSFRSKCKPAWGNQWERFFLSRDLQLSSTSGNWPLEFDLLSLRLSL